MTLILTTMVRNEEKALPRLLASCVGSVTHVALTDTGSTDRTREVAQAECARLGLVLDIRQDVWSDFGTNRTRNLEHGRDVAKTLAPGEKHHLLLLDADMELPPNCVFNYEIPDVLMLTQRDRGSEWKNVRVISADIEARYVGRTHEYIACSAPTTTKSSPVLIDHGDGGCRADKFERDERLLRMDLAENLGNYRSMFYLANTLRSLGRVHEAKAYYDIRAKSLDFPEEAFVAKLEAARCSTGHEAEARAWEAYSMRPHRAEPLAEIARRASDSGRHAYALFVSEMGARLPYPEDETLFTDRNIYTWTFPYIDMISSYYVGDRERGMQACEFLMMKPGSMAAQIALDNVGFYCLPIPGVRKPLPFTAPDGFYPASPCLRKISTGWLALIRTVNYTITHDGLFYIPGSRVITRNFLAWYDNDLTAPLRTQELYAPPAPNPQAGILGFEDQRIVALNGTTITLAGVRCDASEISQPELWASTWDTETGAILGAHKISKGNRVEKNWLPFQGGYLYGHNPITFLDADGENPRTVTAPFNTYQFRGSAAPIPFDGGFLYVVHVVATRGRRVYMHRFVHVKSADWDGMRVSRPFQLHGSMCMESCFSINDTKDGILMSCAYEDKELYTLTVPHLVVRNILNEGTK